jgi:predicted nucleic acid-binding protein
MRVVLNEPDRLATWQTIDRPIASEIVRLECLRTIDRARIRLRLSDDAVAEQRAFALDAVAHFELVPLTSAVLNRAADPFPTLLGTLDAIHLATALIVRNTSPQLAFATHDRELAMAARSVGFVLAE